MAFLVAFGAPAFAQETTEISYCWTESGGRGAGGANLVHCRHTGNTVSVYTSYDDVPATLYPAAGTDATGECWYYRTIWTRWIVVGLDGSEAWMRYDPDEPGGPLIDAGWFRRCRSEPSGSEPATLSVWDIVSTYGFIDPQAAIDPDANGFTGLPTFIATSPPARTVERLVSPGTGAVIDVEFTVDMVVIEWGDGVVTEITKSLYPFLVGYPDGAVTHTYETKGFYDLVVSYVWRVRWRVDSGSWITISDIPPTTWTRPYQVDEIVGRLTG